MIMTFDASHHNALIAWAFDPPPLGRPGLTVAAARINPPGRLPEIELDGRLYDVVGVTPAAWLSTAGGGWRRFTGDSDTLSAIASACRPLQQLLLNDRTAFDAALHRYMARCDESRIGGLPVIVLDDGSRAVRLADIALPEVRAGIAAALERLGPDHRIDLEDAPSRPLPPGLIEADLWWWFCRNWSPGGG